MDDRSRDILHYGIKQCSDLSYIRPEDVPDIPLYMDQITGFMDSKLESCKRHPEDKILTKTMINNYTKNRVIPPPEKKKYSKDHLLLMIFVYYLKDFLQINDIKTLLSPLEEHFFMGSSGKSMSDIYQSAFDLVASQTDYMTKDIVRRLKLAQDTFPEAETDEEVYLYIFAFVCLLSFDVYVKKHLIESVIDELNKIREDTDHKE